MTKKDDLLDIDDAAARKPRQRATRVANKKVNATPVATKSNKGRAKAGALTAKELICSLISKGKTDDDILMAVKAQLPESNADGKHCTKYRRELFASGKIPVNFAARGSTEHREWANANPAKAKSGGPHKAFWREWFKTHSPLA